MLFSEFQALAGLGMCGDTKHAAAPVPAELKYSRVEISNRRAQIALCEISQGMEVTCLSHHQESGLLSDSIYRGSFFVRLACR